MNDEYLWQKTGTDPDIEKMEQKLAVFRYRETPLNVPVIENVVDAAEVPRWRISLAFAFAASVMAALLIAVVFISVARKNNDETVFVAGPELEVSSPPPADVDEKKAAPAPKIVPQFAQSKGTKTSRVSQAKDRRPKAKGLRPTTVALTKEEQYAYRQLMLALSVSSSKLKMVQDSINGNENAENSSNDKR